MIVKEFQELRRDRRTLALMIVVPLVLLVVFGYAASFDVHEGPAVVAGRGAEGLAEAVGRSSTFFSPIEVEPTWGLPDAEAALRDGRAVVAFVLPGEAGRPLVLVDGAELFAARAAVGAVAGIAPTVAQAAGGAPPELRILYNPDLDTAPIMIPGLAGVILVVVGTLTASLGLVRERQSGMLERLAAMPLSAWDVFLGKVAPYFAIAILDMALILTAGVVVFDVPVQGSVATLALAALLFLLVMLSLGVLTSCASETQAQAIQLAIMAVLPQILLSGLLFPVASMAAGVRWIAYILPLTYFIRVARAVMLKGTPIGALWEPLLYLALLGAAATLFATLGFRRLLGAGRRAPGVTLGGSGAGPAPAAGVTGGPDRSG